MEALSEIKQILSTFLPVHVVQVIIVSMVVIIVYKLTKPYLIATYKNTKFVQKRFTNLLAITDEFKNNHGSSLRDIVDSIYRTVKNTNDEVKIVNGRTTSLLTIISELPNAPGIYETDENGNCLYVSKKWLDITGLTSEQAIDLGWIAGIYEEDREKVFNLWKLATQTGSRFDMEYRMVNVNTGTITKVLGHCYPIKSGDKVLRFIGAVFTYDSISPERP